MKKILSLCLVVITLGVAEQIELDRLIAVVDGEPILASEVMDNVYQLQNFPGFSNLEGTELQAKVLEKLIDDKVLLARAKMDTIMITPSELETRVNQHLQQLAGSYNLSLDQLQKAVESQTGKSFAEYKDELGKQISEQGVLQKVRGRYIGFPQLNAKEVREFYAEYKDSIPKQFNCVKISHIQKKIKPSKAQLDSLYSRADSLINKLLGGADFEILARENSDDASASSGGDLGFIKKGTLDPDFERIAFFLESGQFSQRPVKTDLGFHIIKVLEKKDNEIRVAQIFLESTPTSQDTLTVQKELEEKATAVKSPTDFAKLANKISEDKKTNKLGGLLGWFEKGQLDPKYKDIVQGLQIGQKSQLVQIDDAWHVFLLNDSKVERMLTPEDDWEQIEQMAQNISMNKKLQEFLKVWRTQTHIDVQDQEIRKHISYLNE